MKSKRLYYTDKIAEVFHKQKTANVKVEEIAQEIGITKKTLYNYFESKKEMIESVVDYISRRKMQEIKQGLGEQTSPIDALVYIAKTMFSTSKALCNFDEPQVNYANSPVIKNIFKERRNELLDIVNFHFNKGVHLGFFEADLDVELASRYYIFQLENLFVRKETISEMMISDQRLLQVLYYYMKGNCTPKGLEHLRESFDIRVTAS